MGQTKRVPFNLSFEESTKAGMRERARQLGITVPIYIEQLYKRDLALAEDQAPYGSPPAATPPASVGTAAQQAAAAASAARRRVAARKVAR